MYKNYPGSTYHKVDFHIHTPQSRDHKNKSATAQDLVDAALEAKLDAIAITDHDDYRFIEKVQKAAKGTNLVVFPGVEISTRDGHLLAIFDPEQTGEHVKDVLKECGIGKKATPYGDEKTICMKNIEEVAKLVQNGEGVAILAHFDGEKGVEKTVGDGRAREKIHGHKEIHALEIIDASKKDKWVEGKNNYPKSRACLQGSDAHSLDEIGSKYTWIKTSKLSISGLHQVLQDPKARIRFPDEYNPNEPRSYIEKIEISQGFLGQLEIDFNPGLNCIVGGQGVGKSAIIEFIRFALFNTSKVEHTKIDHESKLEKLLKPGGTVSVTIHTIEGDRFVISREFTQDPDNSNKLTIEKIYDDGHKENYPTNEVNRYFPILAYSQNEAMSIARDEIQQLELIDNHIDISSEKDKLSQLKRQLKQNTYDLQQLDERLGDVQDLTTQKEGLEKGIKDINDSLTKIQEAQKEPAIRDHQAWIDELHYLKGITEGIGTLKQTIVENIATLITTNQALHSIEIQPPKTTLKNNAELQAAHYQAQQVRKYIENLNEKIKKELDQLTEKIRALCANIDETTLPKSLE
jgi:histidinol phosphatase-like PHP family hydrolase